MATVDLTAGLAVLVRITAAATVQASPGTPGTLTAFTAAPRLGSATAGARLTTSTGGGR